MRTPTIVMQRTLKKQRTSVNLHSVDDFDRNSIQKLLNRQMYTKHAEK